MKAFFLIFVKSIAVIIAIGVLFESIALSREPWIEAGPFEERYTQDYLVVPLSAGYRGETITQVSYALFPKKLAFPTAMFVLKEGNEAATAFTDMFPFWLFLAFFLFGWYVIVSCFIKASKWLRKRKET